VTVSWCAAIAFSAIQLTTDKFCTALQRHDPGPVDPRRIMSYMLVVAAFKLCHPMLFLILVKTRNTLLQL